MPTIENILLRNGFIRTPTIVSMSQIVSRASREEIATILMNLEYYGYALSTEAFTAINSISSNNLKVWWIHTEKELKSITGDDRNIDQFVVYKNFPAEVLNKTEAEYWIPQILMYWGFPNEYFTEPVKPREKMDPKERKSKTLMVAKNETLSFIFSSLLNEKVAWKDWQFDDVVELSKSQHIDFSKIQFKENLVKLASYFIKEGVQISVKTATDVLRLAAGLSDGDVSLRTKVKFKSFNRKTRKFMMNMLNGCANLEEDVARRQGVWKKFFHNLHPGEFRNTHAKVVKVADDLYNDRLITFNALVEYGISKKDKSLFTLLSNRPGEFMRRLVHLLDVFGKVAADSFIKEIPKLTVKQIVSIRKLLDTYNEREYRAFPPKGNWGKLQITTARETDTKYFAKISDALGKALGERVSSVSLLDEETKRIKLPNGADQGIYSRGTSWKIPDNVKFVRSISYWEFLSDRCVWFDNGWNFFDSSWKSVDTLCWSKPKITRNKQVCAAFSGDPTNTKDAQGRAAQVIDLYLDKLQGAGIRYAIWNLLCYSKVPFSEAKDVFAALLWGEEAQTGKIFEPSRAQLSFKVTGDYYTKYVCLIDLETRELVYLDANLKANVSSAQYNGETLSKQMPAFMDYLKMLPTVHDLFKESVKENGDGQILYSSENVELDPKKPTYVFKHVGKQDYKPIDLNKILD